MIVNYLYEYNEETGEIRIVGLPFKSRLVEVPRNPKFNKLSSYLLIEMDLYNAKNYLNIALNTDDPVIKEGMFKIALVSYFKCFTNSKSGRTYLSPNRVYKDIPYEPIECHKKFSKMRNKFIAHDENDFHHAQIGIILNEDEKKYVDIACPKVQSKFDFDENISILQSLCDISLEKVENHITEEINKATEYLNEINHDVISEYQELKITSNRL